MANSINATSTSNGGIITTGDDSGVLNIQTNETTAISIDASQNATFTNGANLPNTFGFKNRIINGAMMISQRGTTFSGLTDGNNGTYTIDRWAWGETGTSTGVQTVSQDTSAPTGFINSLKVQTTTAHSVGTGNWYNAFQYIEGLNCADLAWGTASAASVTLSFWVRSSLTGTFAGALQNSARDRSYVFNYTVSSADTWEQKTITVVGPTSGTWLTTNGRGIVLSFDLGTGSTYQTTANTWASGNYGSSSGAVSVVGTLNATWYITGVQLEKGTQATSFDFRSYGTELGLCQRYYQQWGGNSGNERLATGFNYSSTQCRVTVPLVVTMRTTPTLTTSAAGDWAVEAAGTTTACTTIVLDQASNKIAATNFNVASGLTGGQGAQIMANATTNSRFNLSAEL